MRFDRKKFKALVHYIIWRAGDIPGFGATKLNKVLWFADAGMYVLRGKPITGATYIRERWGPVPKPMMPIRGELEQEGAIRVWGDRFFDRPSTRFKAFRAPDVSFIPKEELQKVDWWIDHIAKEHTAESISEKSHDYGWEIYERGEEIPYRAFLAERIREEMPPADREWAEKRAKELGLP